VLLQVLSDSSASEVWKLQLLELLVPDWLLLPEQAVQLLGVFDKWVVVLCYLRRMMQCGQLAG
jgi:hypothetical protein